jgi:RNA polymerase sigma factor (sigma-70 family)
MAGDDTHLLRAYLETRSEEAFRALVRRHVAMVHGAARRQPGIDEHLASDVAQRVFLALARKASALAAERTLSGWLYVAARMEAARLARTEARRRARETAVAIMNASERNEVESPSWDTLGPAVDAAMAQLGATDREAILLRYFGGRSFADVGHAFAIGEDAARKRVDRALEKLRTVLKRRGVAPTASSLSLALETHAAPPLAETTVAAIVQGAWQHASVAPALSLTAFMSSTKVAVTAAGIVLVLAVTSIVRDAARHEDAHARLIRAEQQLLVVERDRAAATQERAQLAARQAERDRVERETIQRTPNPLRPHLQDPAYRELARTASRARRHLEFQRFYRRMNLSPEQIARFEAIMVRQDQANLDGQVARDLGRDEQAVYRQSGPEWSTAMRELLGEEGKRQLEDYLRSMAVRNFVDEIAALTYATGEPMTLDQADRLLAVVLANDPLYRQGKGTDPGKVNWSGVWEDAAAFLAPAQVATFETAVEVWSLQKRISLSRAPAGGGK